MAKKLVSFVQPNFQQGPRDLNAFYLPYSIGVLWSYAMLSDVVSNNYALDKIVWQRDSIKETASRLSNNNIVGFSTYVWNHEYNYTLAKEIKKINPNVLIVFGGPEPAILDKNLFKNNSFIDIVVKLEGELTFCKILESLHHGNDLNNIPGLLINNNGLVVDTGDALRITSLEDLPSPYLSGVFDQLILENPDIEWNATLETNRGCPYACTFCDWGSLTYNKVKKFNLERVFAEIEWFGKNKCGFLSFADANFGMFIERDGLIVDKVIETQNKYGYPKTYTMTWAKNQKREVVDIVKKVAQTNKGYNVGLALSLQTLDTQVLKNIRRNNMEINKVEEIFDLCEQNNIPLYTEMILGLPGETLETWRENFWKLFRSGNHNGIAVYQSQMLENAEMNTFQRRLFKMETTRIYDYFSNVYHYTDEARESVETVISTKDMPYDDMIEAELFTWFINTFHINAVSSFLSRFVQRYCNIDYSEFYLQLHDFMIQDPWVKQQEDEMRGYYHYWFKNGKTDHPPINGIDIHGSKLLYRTVLNLHVDQQYNHIYKLLYEFMQRFDIPVDILEEVFVFQRNYVVAYDQIKLYPKSVESNWNIFEYVSLKKDLVKQKVQHTFDFPEDKEMTFQTFLDKIYFSRRRNFGQADIKVDLIQ